MDFAAKIQMKKIKKVLEENSGVHRSWEAPGKTESRLVIVVGIVGTVG